jgi:hypothetical protein
MIGEWDQTTYCLLMIKTSEIHQTADQEWVQKMHYLTNPETLRILYCQEFYLIIYYSSCSRTSGLQSVQHLGLNHLKNYFWVQGVVASTIAYYIQGLCMHVKGLVFATTFSPLRMIIVAIVGSIILSENIFFFVSEFFFNPSN